ncbi:FAD/NAD(P)-binding protein [Terrihabitans sp. PJ23]|uniref:FAD/NAD(P)-binding protein n=2 Tax=Terrihabitans rhizophilus TaxID=3092662 RepID=A0ABU4RIM6_9HYPH|nr:FAD/NAD(P)-binding protein [Terrihabitans sp. PJ23]
MSDAQGRYRRIGVVGGGFTGAAFAVHLARLAPSPVSIEIIEPREQLGAGLAYGSCGPEHRINVPAERMTVFAQDPQHFAKWLARDGNAPATPHRAGEPDPYAPRRVFGAYMSALVEDAAQANPSGSTIRHRRDTAVGLSRTDSGWRVDLRTGGPAVFDHVVVCSTYGAPPFRWPLSGGAEALPHLVRNPWDQEAIAAIPPDADIAIIGTGLTMCDAVVTLRTNGHRGRVHAISRRALTPRPHAGFDTEYDLFEGTSPPSTALGLMRLLRSRIANVEAAGGEWQTVIDSLRRKLHVYWKTLPLPEQAKIARRLRPFWDVHRFRIAPQVADLIASGRESGWLTISPGHILGIGSTQDRFRIDWRPRRGDPRREEVDAIINCTGPDSDILHSGNPFLQSALQNGYLAPDALRAGLAVDAHGRLLNRSGSVSPCLWAAGPFARAVVGEATGVPEASAQARHVAEAIASELSGSPAASPLGEP